MFEQGNWDERVDQLELLVRTKEAEISRLRAEQVVALRELDRYQIDTTDGARTMGDWVSSHLDLSHQTASRLMTVANGDDPEIEANLATGKWGLDRAALLVKLRVAGASPELFSEAAERYSLGRLYGLLDRLRHLCPADEQDLFEYRYLVIQPNLDESAFKLWGHLPGHDGQVVAKALTHRADELPALPHEGQGQRMADALTTICLDSLTESSEGTSDRAVTVAEIFVDASMAAESFGEQGATVSSGPRVGPNTLSEILCTGKIRVIVTDGDKPISYSDLGEAIPPHIRSYVLWRDQGQCSIEGCPSRYRLQPHHIVERQHGGSHDPDNLITLCWYHHHIAIHQLGMTIDPSSPTHRRRVIGPKTTTGPPPPPPLQTLVMTQGVNRLLIAPA
jgi:5-methylcytosine-specific restriction endonuclease McrA